MELEATTETAPVADKADADKAETHSKLTLEDFGITLPETDPLSSHAHAQPPRLPKTCRAKDVPVDAILAQVQDAGKSGQTVSLLAKVGDCHAAVARSSLSHDSAASLSHAIGTHVLPVLAACFGGLQRFASAFVGLKEVSHVMKAARAKLRMEGARAAVQSITSHLALASILAWAGSLQSLSEYELVRRLETHDIEFADGHLTVAPARLQVGHHVAGPKKPVRAHVRELLDLLKLDLGVAHSRLAVDGRSFRNEGIARTRDLRSVLCSHIEWLWQNGAFRDALPARFTVFFKFSADCAKLGKFAISKCPLFCDLVSVLWDESLFEPQTLLSVGPPQLVTVAVEQDTIDGVCGQARLRASALLQLGDPVVLRNEDGSIAHHINLQLLARPADARESQIESGNYCSNSLLRCFICPMPQTDYNNLSTAVLGMGPLKSLVMNAFDRCDADDSNGFARSDVLLADLQLPCSAESLFQYLDERGLWSLMPAPDPLHMILNHSAALQQLFVSRLPKHVLKALSADLVETIGMPFEQKLRAGWQWRLLWSATEVFERHLAEFPQLLSLVLTLCRIDLCCYSPPDYRNAKTLLRLVTDCFTHEGIWRELEQTAQLADHFLFPHLMFAFRDMPLCLLLTEAGEAVFRLFRRIDQQASFHSDDYITGLLQRYLAYVAVRQALHGLRRSPAIEFSTEPCAGCAAGVHVRSRIDPAVTGDTAPFFKALYLLGFDRTVVTRELAGGVVEVFDAHLDPVPASPVLPSLSQLALQRETDEKARLRDLFVVPDSAIAPAAPDAHQIAPMRLDEDDPDAKAGQAEYKQSHRAADELAAEDQRPWHVPLSTDDYLTDAEIASVFGTESEQREEEERERAQAREDDAKEPAWQSRGPLTKREARVLCKSCGKRHRPAHTHAKMSLDD